MSEESVDLSPYIHAIRERFDPADDEGQATHRLSTEEITDAINALNPGCGATNQDTYKALRQAGFGFCSPKGGAGLQFKWLMIEK
jgi:hypothetical protein